MTVARSSAGAASHSSIPSWPSPIMPTVSLLKGLVRGAEKSGVFYCFSMVKGPLSARRRIMWLVIVIESG